MRIISVSAGISWRRANRIRGLKTAHERHSMVIGNLWKRDLFKAFTSLLVVLVLVLAKLAAAVGAKTVKVSCVCQRHCMSFTA